MELQGMVCVDEFGSFVYTVALVNRCDLLSCFIDVTIELRRNFTPRLSLAKEAAKLLRIAVSMSMKG
jgi:hypothetical protein